MRKISKNGLDFIKGWEKLRLQAYKDLGGVWTIGYGSTAGVQPGMIITQEQAEEMLENDLSDAQGAVERLVKVPLNDNEYAALVSFAFNCGAGALQKSTLLRCLNMKNRKDAAEEFLKWDHVNKVYSEGLENRRKEEKLLFLKAC